MAKKFASKNDSFADAVIFNLPYIDKILIHDEIALGMRPIMAAWFFVNELIVDIKGDTKEDFINKPWFKLIVDTSTKWYVDKYGKSVLELDKNVALAIVGINGIPIKLSIPLTLSKLEKPGETRWITLASTILPEEDVLSFIYSPPNLNAMKRSSIEKLRRSVSRVAVNIRCININLMTAFIKANPTKKIAGTIQSHIYAAARNLLSPKAEEQMLAFWEMQMSIEKSVKALMMQKGITVPKKHDLNELFKVVNLSEKSKLDCRMLKGLPSSSEAIALRYGENAQKYDAVRTYYKVLDIVAKITGAMERKIVLNNAKVLIKKAPWL